MRIQGQDRRGGKWDVAIPSTRPKSTPPRQPCRTTRQRRSRIAAAAALAPDFEAITAALQSATNTLAKRSWGALAARSGKWPESCLLVKIQLPSSNAQGSSTARTNGKNATPSAWEPLVSSLSRRMDGGDLMRPIDSWSRSCLSVVPVRKALMDATGTWASPRRMSY
ncbi:hypothetical protein VTK56DRAFT_5311 [Thermocarpiscus australiensis]